jgi:hypothetical protein
VEEKMQLYLKGCARRVVIFTMTASLAATIQVLRPSASAQNATTGSINGTVMDSTGAVVPDAAVTVTYRATGTSLKLTTNPEGRFTASFLKPDIFQVSATSPGLQSVTTTVQVLTGQQSAVNVMLTPTASVQEIQVNANNVQLIDTQETHCAHAHRGSAHAGL